MATKKEYSSEIMTAFDTRDMNAAFKLIYNDDELVSKTLPFNDEWDNGTGYFNGLMTDTLDDVEIGEMVRSRSPGKNNRRILAIKTQFGNVVVFERYTPEEGDKLHGPVVSHVPQMIRASGMVRREGPLDIEDFRDIVGDGCMEDNVGVRLGAFLALLEQRGARVSARVKFKRLEAKMVMAENLDMLLSGICLAGTMADAKDALLAHEWDCPIVNSLRADHPINEHSEEFGLLGNGKYRFTVDQAVTILTLRLFHMTTIEQDQVANDYHDALIDLSQKLLQAI